MSKYIFVTGGVISGLGKGVSAASLGLLLKSRGYSVFVLKLDPYLNIDPGVMSPYEHGEVFVTEDGGETDLDLGHYERFINENFFKDSNYTSGKIFNNIFTKERQGFYSGKTVQYIPHVTNEIKNVIKNIEKKYKKDFIIVEIGGTVGDIESNPFIYAISELAYEANEEKTFFIHVTYVPYLNTSKEFKTKPSQYSINTLRSMGIKANMILLRSDNEIETKVIEKISKISFLNKENVISIYDLDNVYKSPLLLEEKKADQLILKYFNLPVNKNKALNKWKEFVKLSEKPAKGELNVKLIAKYSEFQDAYKSIIEALKISAIYKEQKLNLDFINSEELNEKTADKLLNNSDAILIMPGFGVRGFEGKIFAAQYARDKNIPTLGICLGMQAMTIAQARNKGIKNATSKEFLGEKEDEVYVLDLIKGKNKNNIGGTLRLGRSEIILKNDSVIANIYKTTNIFERHRHRYEVQEKFVNILEDENFVFSGRSVKNNLIEICEDKSKDFYIGVQYHPEFHARPLEPHNLFTTLIEKTIERKKRKNAKQ
ncbi:CTP synthase [Mesomycoplasma neurolyticum]|uniref:CTP synthase (glutamine hydrolyzing) n=1 Tax=Mesomycoplasma neurolyticum TaxID=2120 RepID=A0A449A4N1_9BACT|nr:CTP synthase [Mesomycoplasma neurolyticum]VEU59182.1 CTP synthetase [Mesomycoplasma neurolyticum]